MRYKNSVRFPNAYGMPGMQRVFLTHLLVSNSPTTLLPPANTPAEDIEEFPCAICMDEIPEEAGILLFPCLHHQFCYECIWAWLQYHYTCPLCRTRIRAIKTLQYGMEFLRYVNAAGEEVDPEADVEEGQDEDQGEDESDEDDHNQPTWPTTPIIGIVRPRSESPDLESERPSRRPRLESPHTRPTMPISSITTPIIGIVRPRSESPDLESERPSRRPRFEEGTLLQPPGRGLGAPSPTTQGTPSHSPSSRHTSSSITSEDSDENEDPIANFWSRVDAAADANHAQTSTQSARRVTLWTGRSAPGSAFSTDHRYAEDTAEEYAEDSGDEYDTADEYAEDSDDEYDTADEYAEDSGDEYATAGENAEVIAAATILSRIWVTSRRRDIVPSLSNSGSFAAPTASRTSEF
jgi:hypothetical protein